MISLVLEAATYTGSTALLRDGGLVGERSVAMRGREHEALMPAVADLLAESRVSAGELGRVICGAGPGSFTSLRIAGSIAKGIALSRSIPLVPVSSLALLVASQHALGAGRYLAAIDALRDEYYVELYDVDEGGVIHLAGATRIVPTAALGELAAEHGARVVGPPFQDGHVVEPRAGAAVLLTNLIDATPPAELAGWEPAYGRLAEAQVKWEAAHGRPLAAR